MVSKWQLGNGEMIEPYTDDTTQEPVYVLAVDYAALEARCRAEEAAHAELQSRCFDYGGTFQNVFDDVKASKARIAELEGLLRELIDIEGPQPGHVMWARKVAEALGTTLETIADPPIEYVRCLNWPCVLPHRHIGPCTTGNRSAEHK